MPELGSIKPSDIRLGRHSTLLDMPFSFEPLDIPDVVRVKPEVFHDSRGFLMESYDCVEFQKAGLDDEFVLDFYSRSATNVVRGLHFQRPPWEQAKLVYCSEGSIFDVALDIRQDSETFGDHVSIMLNESERDIMYIPAGFAHGFAVTEGPAMVHYKASNPYSPEHQGGIKWDDPDLGIDWPVNDPIISERDAEFPKLFTLTEGN